MKLTASVLAAVALAASSSACSLAGCDKPDSGSCGNACCSLTISIPMTTTEVMNSLNATITAGGPDGLYTPMMTAEGTLTFGDLKQFGAPVDFIGQAEHQTINGQYTDTVNFTLEPSADGKSTTVNAFSISQIAGAFGDDGQNHWNIAQLFDEDSKFAGVATIANKDSSCTGSK
jgi:hypothetical protein